MIRGPLEADGRMAAKNAVKIRAALKQVADFNSIFDQYADTHPVPSNNRAMDRARARAWAIMNIRLHNEALESVIWWMWAEAYVLGDLAAQEWIAHAKETQKAVDPKVIVDWSKWKPGDLAAALMLRRPRGFRQLLEQSGVLIRELSRTTLDDIGTALADSIELGLSAVQASKLIARHVASPSRALTIAITEQNRAMTAASMERYRAAEIEQVEWEVSDPCDKCAQNQGVVVTMGQSFPSGVTQPPQHPHCRCVLLPIIPGSDEWNARNGVFEEV